ncbi:MAG: aminoacyl-tRNA hydrolase [Alphaproteobacteria bacterium]|nr:aminoacyl-tRNA hydrolase [Alphaproteobacteria bacterium]
MLLLAGLGNPGSEYAQTRHNVGFMAVDELAHRYSFLPFKDKLKGQIATGSIDNQKIILLKPMTFMNLSGESVLAVCSFYKLKPADIIVFHDDMDLPVGKIKVKRGGSAGGHNGLKSIDSQIGPDYLRVRIGIGRPENKKDVVDWVLHPFMEADQKTIADIISQIAEYAPLLVAGNDQTFMNRLTQFPKS